MEIEWNQFGSFPGYQKQAFTNCFFIVFSLPVDVIPK